MTIGFTNIIRYEINGLDNWVCLNINYVINAQTVSIDFSVGIIYLLKSN